MTFDENAPVIIAAAQQTWRDADPARTPQDALEAVARKALADADCAALAEQLDTFATVRSIMETDPNLAPLLPRNPGADLAHRLGLEGARCLQAGIGGNTPQLLVNHCAALLAAGEAGAVLVSGADMLNSFFAALREGADISAWQGQVQTPPEVLNHDREPVSDAERAHGLYEPINTYPLFENALQHHLGRSHEAHMAEVTELCSGMSAVAAANSLAWRREALSAEAIGDASASNRYIGYPYTKAMNAILAVDMAAAVIMTTAGKALSLGIPSERLVFVRGGIDVNDSWHVSQRPALHQAPAIGLAARALLAHTGVALEDIAHFDIYSCFPSAVQVACREIGLSPQDPRGVTITGGLPFFGGPGNNYSLHAIAEMSHRLRGRANAHGLVTANGLYLTKHSLGLYSTAPPRGDWSAIDSAALQQELDQLPVIPMATQPAGPARIVSYTVAFGKSGPKQAIVLAENESSERVLATSDDPATMAALLQADPIGLPIAITVADTSNAFELSPDAAAGAATRA